MSRKRRNATQRRDANVTIKYVKENESDSLLPKIIKGLDDVEFVATSYFGNYYVITGFDDNKRKVIYAELVKRLKENGFSYKVRNGRIYPEKFDA